MTDLFRLDGKVATVIGGAGGLGEAIAHGLAQYGARVVIASRNLQKLEKVAMNISSDPEVISEVTALQVDVTDEQSVARLAEQIVDKFGTVDILVNAHGENIKKPSVEFPMADWERLFDINVKGTMTTCREFGKIMIEKRKGKIINLSSIRGARGTDGGNTGYGATKGAVDMITRMLAAEWARYNINVNAIAPSIIMTEMLARALDPARLEMLKAKSPLGRMAEPKDIVGMCILLASAASDFISGQIIYIDGGLSAIA
jgi:NAD(P)-dependent dehydrogenase (short-subunit alcohol dehydrogenase family)